jgi:hypothetical protein
MSQSQSFSPFQSSQPESPTPAYGAAIYTHPSDVTSDPKLTGEEKSAVLASLVSDARAVDLLSRWLRRVGPPNGSDDNDDDPPPAPAGFGIPFRPKPLSPAHGTRLERVPMLACATG